MGIFQPNFKLTYAVIRPENRRAKSSSALLRGRSKTGVVVPHQTRWNTKEDNVGRFNKTRNPPPAVNSSERGKVCNLERRRDTEVMGVFLGHPAHVRDSAPTAGGVM